MNIVTNIGTIKNHDTNLVVVHSRKLEYIKLKIQGLRGGGLHSQKPNHFFFFFSKF